MSFGCRVMNTNHVNRSFDASSACTLEQLSNTFFPLIPPGGDVKGGAKVEPYAYWPLDRRLMNRRQQKAKGAKQGLDKIVAAAKAGAAKGHKAKRQRR